MQVAQNILAIKNELPAQVTLVAVSKFKSAELILEAYTAGQRDFGENYVQELLDKHTQLPEDIRWHFIGHLQRNKVKYIVPFVYLIQGVDSFKLLQEINKEALKNKRLVNCLLQLHIAREETKFGFSFEECLDVFESGQLSALTSVKVLGLMAMASNTENTEEVAAEYRSLNDFKNKLEGLGFELPIMSYGMSGDYKLAIENGSNMVRIGSSIFGHR